MTNYLYQERPYFPASFDFIDQDCKTIAEHLTVNINETFKYALDGKDIIRTYRAYNDLAIPNTDYPCLKVYKVSEELFTPITSEMSTGFVISYILSFTQPPKVSDVSTFVAREIIRLITNAHLVDPPVFQVDTEKPIAVEYDTMIDPQRRIYKYTNVNCSIFTNYLDRL